MAESTDDDSIMVSKSQEYNIKHYSDSMINTSNQVSFGTFGLQALKFRDHPNGGRTMIPA